MNKLGQKILDYISENPEKNLTAVDIAKAINEKENVVSAMINGFLKQNNYVNIICGEIEYTDIEDKFHKKTIEIVKPMSVEEI